jgi:putative nucleotidyltransferase with HDIG domain
METKTLPTRAEAWALLTSYTTKPGLLRHALAVEAALRAYAPRFQGDPDLWGLTGLLHDLDYERWPDPKDHPLRGAEILRAHGYPEELVYAVLTHASYLGYPRRSALDRALFACDELTGFLVAVALVMPHRSLREVELPSIKKKWKSKEFAKAVSREDVEAGARELGVDLDEHIAFVLRAMQAEAEALGLA